MTELTTSDRNVLVLGGALVLFGTFGIGLIEILAGSAHPVTGEGQIVHEALFPIALRSYTILLGLLIWGLFAVYRFLTVTPTGGATDAY